MDFSIKIPKKIDAESKKSGDNPYLNARDEIASAMRCVETALNKAPGCSTGLAAQKWVLGIKKGPSGGPEMLAILYIDDPSFGCWYGHILQHPQKPQVFVSQIVWTDKFINAGNTPLLFKRFHYWIKERFEHHPCTIQNSDDAYAESSCLGAAALELARMIAEFDFDRRSGIEGTGFENDPVDLRGFEVYEFRDTLLKSLEPSRYISPVPMPTELKIVKIQG